MKPLYLSIEGINSFTAKQEVYFERLAEQGLFCICGATGSGKTTILDSIVLALYGRGGRGKLSDYINLSSNYGRVELEFESEGVVYRVERTFYKAASKSSSCLLTNKTESRVLADQIGSADAKLREIIGLPREEFTQVAIIEQGKFSEFLSAEKGARNAIVGNLFRLSKFKGLSTLFNSRLAVLNERERNIQKSLAECGEATKESIEKVRAERAVLEREQGESVARQEGAKKTVEALNKQRLEWESALKAREAKEASEKELAQLNRSLEEEEARLKRIDLYKEEAEQKRQSIEADNKLFFELEGLKNTYKIINTNQTKLKELKENLADLAQKTDINASKCKGGVEEIARLRLDIIDRINRIKQIHRFDIEASEGFLPKPLRLQMEGYKQTIAEKTRQISQIKGEIAQIQGVIAEERREQEASQLAWREAVNRSVVIVNDRNKLSTNLTAQRQELRAQQIKNSAENIRKGLKNGDKCPVCAGVFEGKAEETGQISSTAPLEEGILRLEAEIESLTKEHLRIEAIIAALVTKVESHEKQIKKGLNSIELAQNALKTHSEDILIESEFVNLGELIVASISQLNDLEGLIALNEGLIKEGESLKGEEKRITKEIGLLDAETQSNKGALEEKTGGRDLFELQREIEGNLTKNTDFVARFDKSRQETEQAILSLNNKRLVIVGELKSLSVSAEEPSFDKEGYDRAIEELALLEEEIKNRNSLIIRKEFEIKDLEDRSVRRAVAEGELKENTRTKDNLASIIKLIKGDRFLEYVAEEYILRFTESASEILSKISEGKYTLVYQEGVFYVRDFLMGNELRRTSTLSGGETFLASLSLAVAITEEISAFKSFEFFFLDEGFGTLDVSSIDTVYEALSALSRDTLVGIVTHRSELVEKIPTRLIVTKASDECGSTITASI